MKASFVTLLMTCLFSSNSFAHGMNKPGVNNGYVRMPGAYHVELVPISEGFRVYFQDIQFKSISTKDATLNLVVKAQTSATIGCKKEEANTFVCPVEKAALKGATELVLESSINNGKTKGSSVYKYPLSFN